MVYGTTLKDQCRHYIMVFFSTYMHEVYASDGLSKQHAESELVDSLLNGVSYIKRQKEIDLDWLTCPHAPC